MPYYHYIQRLARNLLGLPEYRSLAEAFEKGEFKVSVIEMADVMGEAELVAESASGAVPCDLCGKDVKEYPKVGWAVVIVEYWDEEPARIKGSRLCFACSAALIAEDKVREDVEDPSPPYIERLILVEAEGQDWVYRNFGVFRSDAWWASR